MAKRVVTVPPTRSTCNIPRRLVNVSNMLAYFMPNRKVDFYPVLWFIRNSTFNIVFVTRVVELRLGGGRVKQRSTVHIDGRSHYIRYVA